MPIEPPYGIIRDQLERGEIIPFLGAGASLCGRPVDGEGHRAEWTGHSEPFLPSGAELGRWLGNKCRYPEDLASADLAKIASYYEIRAQRQLLTRSLTEVFARDYPCTALHDFLAEWPRPLLIVTTNYDDLIEKAFRTYNRPYHLVTHPEFAEYAGCVLWWPPDADEPRAERPNEFQLELDDISIIYKMHGTASAAAWNSFVITEEDYVRFLAQMTERQAVPARFKLKFQQSRFLFLGYGLRDWNFRVMLEGLRIRGHTGQPKASVSYASDTADLAAFTNLVAAVPDTGDRSRLNSWAISLNTSDLERTLWTYRNVQVFDTDLNEFVTQLRSAGGAPIAPPPQIRAEAP